MRTSKIIIHVDLEKSPTLSINVGIFSRSTWTLILQVFKKVLRCPGVFRWNSCIEVQCMKPYIEAQRRTFLKIHLNVYFTRALWQSSSATVRTKAWHKKMYRMFLWGFLGIFRVVSCGFWRGSYQEVVVVLHPWTLHAPLNPCNQWRYGTRGDGLEKYSNNAILADL